LNKVLCTLLDTTWGHHGKPIRPGRLGELEDHLVDDNILHAKHFIEDAVSLIQPEWPVTFFTSEVQNSFRQISWHFAGIATLA
ncbi:hypothetical protein, partial [Salmonella sp. ZJHZ21_0024]|uniref:hypothetical protein n=1 Tax=Salmonella sp. ZJHZ21_0024 TaxID=3159610 RepID=UPI00398080E1